LSNFVTVTNSVTLSSSSNIVGETGVKLSVSVTPGTKIKASGIVIVSVPEYFTNAGSNYIIGSNNPTCTGTLITVSNCVFI
jgi:hypothetical protein